MNLLQQYIDYDNNYDTLTPTDMLSQLVSHIQRASLEIFPRLLNSNKHKKKYRNDWITSGILKSMERRDELFDKWMKTKSPSDRLKYNLYRNKVNRIVIAAKKKQNGICLHRSQSNTQKFWKCLNMIVKRTPPAAGSNLPDELKLGDTTINDPKQIANELNSHFVSKGPSLAEQLPKSDRNIFQSMGPRNPCNMVFQSITDRNTKYRE